MATEAAPTSQKKEGLSLTFASPSQSFYKDTKVRQVDVPSYSGSLGILANHVPILAVMKPGVVSVIEDDGTAKKYFVAAGTVTMNEDSSLLLLASEAVAVEDLDLGEAQKNLTTANSQSTPEGKIAAEVNQAILDSGRA
jgi:F-type H+-transporting ATPase subunit delta